MTMLSGAAKATTPFGPLAGRTAIHVSNAGEDCAVIEFHCGPTPVLLTVADGNFTGLIRALIAQASAMNRGRLTAELDEALEGVA